MKKDLQSVSRAVFFLLILFLLCSTISFGQHNPLIGSGNSYVNISKQSTGGFIQVGDTLEIRTNHFWGSAYNSSNASKLFSVRYYDSVPLKTSMLTGTAD